MVRFLFQKKNVSSGSKRRWICDGEMEEKVIHARMRSRLFSYFITFYNGLIKSLWIPDKHTYKYKYQLSMVCWYLSIAAARQFVGQNFKIVKSNRHKYFYGSRWWQFLGPNTRTYYYYDPVVAFMSHEWTAEHNTCKEITLVLRRQSNNVNDVHVFVKQINPPRSRNSRYINCVRFPVQLLLCARSVDLIIERTKKEGKLHENWILLLIRHTC